MPSTTFAEIHRVASAPMVCSPGLWRCWFETARKNQKPPMVHRLPREAFTRDRLTHVQMQAILDGYYHVREEEDETLVICVPE